jgi:hypothetical protein
MASGSKESSIFTGNPTGDGPSKGIKKSSMPGGTIMSAYPQDNVHGYDCPSDTGGSMGGGVTNLGHSLSGASAVQRSKGKPESSGI